MNSKIKFKTKKFEFEWDTSEQLGTDEIVALFRELNEIDLDDFLIPETESKLASSKVRSSIGGTFTTGSAMSKLKLKSPSDLFKIALAKLQLVDGKEIASRGEIHDEMKGARSAYQKNMGGNLSNTISSLISSGAINEPTHGNYCLVTSELEKISELLSK
jgi:hypothetical protein